jgi:hypothetical protein
MTTTAIWIMVSVGATALIALLAYWFFPKLRDEVQGYPFEAQIESLLLPLIYKGIIAAYKLSEKTIDDIGDRLYGVDKKKLADFAYDLLPEEIGGIDIRIIKSIITRERFSQLTEDVFQEFLTFYNLHDDRYHELWNAWIIDQET